MKANQVSGIVTDMSKRQESGARGTSLQVWNFNVEVVGEDRETSRVPMEIRSSTIKGDVRNGDKVRVDISRQKMGNLLQVRKVYDDEGILLVRAGVDPKGLALLLGSGLIVAVIVVLITRSIGGPASTGGPDRAYCIGLKEQWDFMQLHFPKEPKEVLKTLLKDKCGISVQ